MMVRTASRWLQLLFGVTLLAGCGGTGMVSVDDERQAGEEISRQVEEQVGIYPGEYLTTYLDSVGRRLVSGLGNTPYSFRFKIIDQAEPNAFAAPGGNIFVSRGLMGLINSEDELAGILAHEISHITGRHHARQAQRAQLPGVLTLPGKAVGKLVGEDVGNVINAPIEAAGKAYTASYGRGQESEADLTGMQLAARAGYDPEALASALVNLERTVTLMVGEQREFSFFDSHPMTPTRVAEIESHAATLQWRAGHRFAKDRAAVLRRIDGLTWGPNNPMQGGFSGPQFMQADMNISMTFPTDWRTVNTPLFVGGFSPDDNALILFGTASRSGPAASLGAEFVEELRKEFEIEPAEARDVEIGEYPAYLVRIEDSSGVAPVSVYYVWINAGNNTFQILAAGADDYRDQLRDTALSLRELTTDERKSIMVLRIRTATVEAGEDLAGLSARTGNQFSPELTAAVNGLADDAELAEGELIKILKHQPYVDRP
jgi:predicted Zn-dependent protease